MDSITNSIIGEVSGNSNGGLFDLSSILNPLMPFVILITIVSILITVLYVIGAVTSYRSQRAILDIRKTLNEINQRQISSLTKPETVQPIYTEPPRSESEPTTPI